VDLDRLNRWLAGMVSDFSLPGMTGAQPTCAGVGALLIDREAGPKTRAFLTRPAHGARTSWADLAVQL
jgi:hypothetical protein